MLRVEESRPAGTALAFARVVRIVLTCCLAVSVAVAMAWVAQQWWGGTQGSGSIAQGPVQVAGTAPPRDVQPGDVIGRILIPALGLDAPLVEMANVDDMENLNKGPAHIAKTALPGARGNCVIAGHRTTHSRPFLHLDQMRGGDVIQLIDLTGHLDTYTVTGITVVDPRDVSVMDPTPNPTVTLIACHPAFTARQRLVVKASMNTP